MNASGLRRETPVTHRLSKLSFICVCRCSGKTLLPAGSSVLSSCRWQQGLGRASLIVLQFGLDHKHQHINSSSLWSCVQRCRQTTRAGLGRSTGTLVSVCEGIGGRGADRRDRMPWVLGILCYTLLTWSDSSSSRINDDRSNTSQHCCSCSKSGTAQMYF